MTNLTGDALVMVGVAETQHHVKGKTVSDAAHSDCNSHYSLPERGDMMISLTSARGVKLVPSSAAMRKEI